MSHWKKQLEVLSRASRRWADEAGSPVDDRASWEALQDRRRVAPSPRPWRPAPWRPMLAAAVLLLGVGAGLWWKAGGSLRRQPASPLFVVKDGASAARVADGKTSQASAPHLVRFSDGSSVAFGAAARGDVLATDERGAHLHLAEGRAHFDVVHRASTNWLVDAGPFSVLVHGTVFDVKWAPTTGAFEVALFEGVVSVRGPLPGGEVTLRAGQHLAAVFHEGAGQVTSFEVSDLRPGGSQEEESPPSGAPGVNVDLSRQPGPALEPGAASRTPVLDRQAQAGRPSSLSPVPSPAVSGTIRRSSPRRATSEVAGERARLGHDWDERVALGDFSTVLREAESDGIDHCLSTLPMGSLRALVDAARYGRKTDIALRALQAERTRFPGSPVAQDAGFLMGRLTEDNLARPAEAITWYERYLAESGNGRYAGDALGRLMLARERLGEKEAARHAARTYLARHPDGAYVESARRLAHD